MSATSWVLLEILMVLAPAFSFSGMVRCPRVCQFGVSGNWKMPWDTPLTTMSPGRQPSFGGLGIPPHLVAPLGSPAMYHHVTLHVPSAGAMTALNCKASGLPCPRIPPTSPLPEQIAQVRRLAPPNSVLPGASASYEVVVPPVPMVSVTSTAWLAVEPAPVTLVGTVPACGDLAG